MSERTLGTKPPATMHKTIDVLLIDDCDADSKMTSAAVHRAAPTASIVRVKHPEQALRLMFCSGLFSRAPDVPRLIVLEVDVRYESGRVVLQQLHERSSMPAVPVLVLTSCSDPRILDDSYALGASECLVKPKNVERYLHEVTGAIERHLKLRTGRSRDGRGG